MSQVVSLPEASATALRPLCVDLDGTLVKSDTLVDSLLVLARTHPAWLFALPGSLLHGKAAFKAFVTSHVSLDVAHLPYNRTLLQFLHEECARGRSLYLVTGADVRLAQRVAEHLGIFTGVLGSDGEVNLTGTRKLDRVRSEFGGEYGYIGNDTPDLPMLAHAAEIMVANPSLRLRFRMRLCRMRPLRTFDEGASSIWTAIRAMRVHQWAKNLLIFLPLLLAHTAVVRRLPSALLAFFCFSLTASSAYIINDLFDIEVDRRHPKKLQRPFAAGDLPAVAGFCMVAGFLLLAFLGARLLPMAFSGWLLLYLVSTLAYSWVLKRIALVDVLVLSGLYTLAPVRRQRRYRIAHLALAGRLFCFSVFLSGHRQAFCRAAEFAQQRIAAAQRARLPGGRYRSVAKLRHVQRLCGCHGLRPLHQQQRHCRALSPPAIVCG